MDLKEVKNNPRKKIQIGKCVIGILLGLTILNGIATATEKAKITNLFKHCTASTTGNVVASNRSRNKIEFTVNGKTYKAVEKKNSKIVSATTVKVSYNPKKPRENYVGAYPNRTGFNRALILTILTGILSGAGIGLFIKLRRNWVLDMEIEADRAANATALAGSASSSSDEQE